MIKNKKILILMLTMMPLASMAQQGLKDAIGDLEKAFKVAQDNVWKGAGIGVRSV